MGTERGFLADRGHREARVVEGGTIIRIRVEVLPVLLAERSPSRGRVSSIVVSQGRAPGSTMLLITKSFPADVPVTRASEGQHRVGRVDAGDAVAACDQFARE